ncbi:hypothetical protein D9757_004512 [Collybiopsis confluens]|uniref:Uncharacterized protein n=1 Tax=Collybiopsis confluens TaxID=2823264 RepID=A0A8H5MEB2_9AGAR|nr:hypothetical protein D9757_004512 [Collybiopsis confluens]
MMTTPSGSSSAPVRFPTYPSRPSDSESISRARFDRARRVPSHSSSNRHMACVGETYGQHKVTFCSSLTSTYTTVTFKAPAPPNGFRHPDAAAVFCGPLRRPPVTESGHGEGGIGKGSKGKNYRKMLKNKVAQLLRGTKWEEPTQGYPSVSGKGRYPAPSVSGRVDYRAAYGEPVVPSKKGPSSSSSSSLFHFGSGRSRNGSGASKASTIGVAGSSAGRSNRALDHANASNTGSLHRGGGKPRESWNQDWVRDQTQERRRSRSFSDAERSFFSSPSFAERERERGQAGRRGRTNLGHGHVKPSTRTGLENVNEDVVVEEALDRAARKLADGIRRSRHLSPQGFEHLFAEREWADDDEGERLVGPNGEEDLDALLDEATEEARRMASLTLEDGWYMDSSGDIVREVFRPYKYRSGLNS